MRNSTDNPTGLIKSGVYQQIVHKTTDEEELSLMDKHFVDSLVECMQVEKSLDDDWNKIQKELELRYVEIREKYEEARNAYHTAVHEYSENSPQQTQRQGHNAVLDSLNAAAAAVAANALPSKGKKKSRSKKNKNAVISTTGPLNITGPVTYSMPSTIDSSSLTQPILQSTNNNGFTSFLTSTAPLSTQNDSSVKLEQVNDDNELLMSPVGKYALAFKFVWS